MSDRSSELSRNRSPWPESTESEKTILKWVTLLDIHFNRKENLFPEEKKIYIEALRRFSSAQLEEAFRLALHECPYMPKIADIELRLPEDHGEYYSSDFTPVKDWYEPYTATAKLHIWEDRTGNRRVAHEKLRDGERPPRVAGPAPDEYISWDDAWKQIAGIGAAKKL